MFRPLVVIARRFPVTASFRPTYAAQRASAFPRVNPRFTQRFYASTPDDSTTLDVKIAKAKEWFEEGTNRWNNNDLEGAKAAYQESAAQHPTSDNYYNLGNCLYNLGKPDEAIDSWLKCILLDPAQLDAHVNLANVYALYMKTPEKALSHYKIATELNPDDGEVQYNYGVVLDSMGKLEEAVEMYEKAVGNGIEQAEKNLRNARAKLSGKTGAGN
ncbi:hypothetical protein HDU79_009565 [Rhizoclosmatium sp. JEL0117]|nr:hypothetical protein HDU79_009565 [Rhizoclosmatium sp. JEL0117]